VSVLGLCWLTLVELCAFEVFLIGKKEEEDGLEESVRQK
jgi:hypothetical protein